MRENETTLLERFALRTCELAERWFPDAFVFAALAIFVVAGASLFVGAAPSAIARAFGDGFWSLITFTMQMSLIVVGGYVVAASPVATHGIDAVARLPRTGRSAVCMIAALSMALSLIHWGLSLTASSLLVRALARRDELRMDYRAAAAAAYLGTGSIWALGLSSSAAQLQANPASMPPALLAIGGVIPFQETIFLWQSMVLAVIVFAVALFVVYRSFPAAQRVRTARDLGIQVTEAEGARTGVASRPAEKLEHSPIVSLTVVALGGGWLAHEFATKGALAGIANLNTYNFIFIMLGLLLNWRPRRFLDAVGRAVPAASGVLIQFPFYGGIAAMLTTVPGADGQTLSQHLATAFSHFATRDTFPILMGAYSAVLGFFVPSAGGKWLIEAPYVLQAAVDLKSHLGWVVQSYNAAEVLPNLINPFWMLPVLGILGLRARDMIGFTFIQFVVNTPLVLFLLWALGLTLTYHPPVIP